MGMTMDDMGMGLEKGHSSWIFLMASTGIFLHWDETLGTQMIFQQQSATLFLNISVCVCTNPTYLPPTVLATYQNL